MGEAFKSGDVVQLKSGGPLMTVVGSDYDKGQSVMCVWFVTQTGTWERREGLFPVNGVVARSQPG